MAWKSYDYHDLCPQCRIAAGVCNIDVSNPFLTCFRWTIRTWYRLRKCLVDARLRATQRGKQHWSSAFPHLKAWLASRPASTASSEPGSEVSSMMGSGDEVISTTGPLVEDFMVQEPKGVSFNMADNVLPNTVAANQLSGAATPHNTTYCCAIEHSGHAQCLCMPLISMPSAAPTAPTVGLLISMSLAAPTAMQLAAPTAVQRAALPPLLPIMSVRPNHMGYFAGAPSNFYPQSKQFPYMANPSWEASQREQLLQISSFKNDSSLRLGKLVKPSLNLRQRRDKLLIWCLWSLLSFLKRLIMMLKLFQ